MRLKPRPYNDRCDYWRVRAYLRDIDLLDDPRERCWSLLRWDYWRWHVHENICRFILADAVTLWDAVGQSVSMLNPDGRDEAFPQVHPAVASTVLLEEMAARAEVRLAHTPTPMSTANWSGMHKVTRFDGGQMPPFFSHVPGVE